MEGIIDILQSEGTNDYTFVGNNALLDGPLVAPVLAPNQKLQTEDGRTRFVNKDHFTLLSFGLRIPYCYHWSDCSAALALVWRNAGATVTIPITELSAGGTVWIPFADREIEIGTMIRFPSDAQFAAAGIAPQAMYLRYSLANNRISLFDAPDDLNTVTLHVRTFVKVLHSFALI